MHVMRVSCVNSINANRIQASVPQRLFQLELLGEVEILQRDARGRMKRNGVWQPFWTKLAEIEPRSSHEGHIRAVQVGAQHQVKFRCILICRNTCIDNRTSRRVYRTPQKAATHPSSTSWKASMGQSSGSENSQDRNYDTRKWLCTCAKDTHTRIEGFGSADGTWLVEST